MYSDREHFSKYNSLIIILLNFYLLIFCVIFA